MMSKCPVQSATRVCVSVVEQTVIRIEFDADLNPFLCSLTRAKLSQYLVVVLPLKGAGDENVDTMYTVTRCPRYGQHRDNQFQAVSASID